MQEKVTYLRRSQLTGTGKQDVRGNPLIIRLRMLTDLSESALEAIEELCKTVQVFKPGVDIVREGAPSDNLHIVLDGWCCRYRTLRGGRRQIPALLLPGDICDLDRLLLRRVHFGIGALTSCTAASVPREQLYDLMDQNREVRDALWCLMSIENSVSVEWTVGVRRFTEERLAHLLCELLVRLSVVDLTHGGSFTLPLTQEELGEALGVSTVHVNRTLQALRARNLLEYEGRSVVVRDWDALKKLSGFAPDYLHTATRRSRTMAAVQ